MRGVICTALTNLAHLIRIPQHARQKPGVTARLWEPLSLETPLDEDGDLILGDSIADESAISPFDAVAAETLNEQIAQTLNELALVEATVLRMRFGLSDDHQRTCETVAEQIGRSPERVRQIEAKALRKLRHPRWSYRLQSWLIQMPQHGTREKGL